MNDLVVIAPVLGRPHRAQPLVDSLAAAATLAARLLFMCTRGDWAQIEACRATGADMVVVDWPAGLGDWARKINLAVRLTGEPYLLLAADDVHFHPGFDTAMARVAEQGFGVIGARDLGNPTVDRGNHSCHPLVTRSYVAQGTIDDPTVLLHEGYRHNYVDTELVETAKARRQFGFAHDAVVEHRHPFWGKAEDDDTYALGRDGYTEDRRLYERRRLLWTRGIVAA